jgi:hypothetical protein
VNDLLGAFDVAFSANKQRTGNPKVETHKYVIVNVPVPKLKDGDLGFDSNAGGKENQKSRKSNPACKNEYPKWAVSAEWEAANPELEIKSRYHINAEKTEIPELEKIKNYIYCFQPEKRTYNAPSSSLTVTAAPAVPNPFHGSVPSGEPDFSSEIVNNSAPMVDPTAGTSTAPEPPIATQPRASPPANLDPPFASVTGSHAQSPPGVGMYLGVQHLPFVPGFHGQPLYARNADGTLVLVHIGNQPAMPNYENSVVPHMGMPIGELFGTHSYDKVAYLHTRDPSILGEPYPLQPPNNPLPLHPPPNSTHPPQSNNMPPPPELVVPTSKAASEPSEVADLPTKSRVGRGRGRGNGQGRGRGSRGRGKGRGKATQSKATIEEDKDKDEEGLEDEFSVAGTSQPLSNTGKAKKVTLTVRGS